MMMSGAETSVNAGASQESQNETTLRIGKKYLIHLGRFESHRRAYDFEAGEPSDEWKDLRKTFLNEPPTEWTLSRAQTEYLCDQFENSPTFHASVLTEIEREGDELLKKFPPKELH